MSGGAAVLPGGTNGARFDHDAPGARLAVAPSAFAQGAGANEGSAAPTSHADLAARSAARPATRSMRGCAWRPCAMLAGDLADPGEKALGGRAAAGVGADAAKPRPETIFVIPAHRRCSSQSTQNTVKLAVVPRKIPQMLAFRQGAALRRLLDGAARRLPTSVQTTIFARDGQGWCHPL